MFSPTEATYTVSVYKLIYKNNGWKNRKIIIFLYGYPFTGQIFVNITKSAIITTTKEHAINLSILINVDIGLCGRLECHECDYPLKFC